MKWPWIKQKPGITIFHKYKKPPWGGGNQFLLALKKAFIAMGYEVTENVTELTKLVIFNSFSFEPKLLESIPTDKQITKVHRVDGPTIVVRGTDPQIDDQIFFHDNAYADVTVFQSYWSLEQTLALKYQPINPVIIRNAPDPEIFSPLRKKPFQANQKIALIATSWSNNLKKGFDFFRILDKTLDFNRYSFTFVGNSPYDFKNILVIPPQASKKVAALLSSSDIYIMASQKEACSNALIEAQVCKLPALYFKDGSNPEIVGWGGLGFSTLNEFNQALLAVTKNYFSYQALIQQPSINQIALKYLGLLGISR